jgi:hypothetical protein
MQLDLPSLTEAQIQKLEDFTISLNQLGFKLQQQKESITSASIQLTQEIPFDVFWQAMEQANVPRPRPENFEKSEIWENQIMFIRQHGLPVAWTLIPMLREVAQPASEG